jgi:hypothetical protein
MTVEMTLATRDSATVKLVRPATGVVLGFQPSTLTVVLLQRYEFYY